LAEAKKDPASFAKLAKENSEDKTSAEKGGDLGFFKKEEMVPEFSAVAFELKPNTVSEAVIKTQYGYHIIYVTDRAAAGVEPYEKVKNDIKAYLENQKQLELIDNLVESLKKNAKIEYVNTSYDPANIRQEIQKQYQQSGETAQKEEAEAKK
jgi:parvulin-like peptidyl-prolyl isomerase